MNIRKWYINAVNGLVTRALSVRPYFHLPGYMLRGWMFGGSNPDRDERPDDERGWKRSRLDAVIGRFVACRLHVILRSDAERMLHNHPCRYLSIILAGGYYEVTMDRHGNELRTWKGPGSVTWGGLTHFHRLEVPKGTKAVTLFFMGRKLQPWGFFTFWKNYETQP